VTLKRIMELLALLLRDVAGKEFANFLLHSAGLIAEIKIDWHLADLWQGCRLASIEPPPGF
jgi:hypothetical protein